MSREEMFLAERRLRELGYRYIWRYGNDHTGWRLRARRHDPISPEGWQELPMEIRDLQDLGDLNDIYGD